MKRFLVFLFLSISICSYAQESDSPYDWDNLLYVGNKVSWGSKNFKNSAELQFRLQDNMRSLQQYFVEYVGTWLINEHVELVPDLRIALKPTRVEYRPGFGVVLKHGHGKNQFVHQIKGQIDFESTGGNTQLIRYFPSYNRILNEHWLLTTFAGAYYKLTEKENDFSAFVIGLGAAYVINKQHALNFSYLYAAQQNIAEDIWFPAGGVILRLVININKDYDYEPARYINF